MSMATQFAAAYAKAVELDMEEHHERMHQIQLTELAEYEASNPMSAEDIQAQKAVEMMHPHLS